MTLCTRIVLLSLAGLAAFGQTTGNFSLSMKSAAVSVVAGASATTNIQISALSGYSQPVYLMPGVLPDGVSVVVPSPVVGTQAVTMEVRAAATVKAQTYFVDIYAAAGGENHTARVSIAVLPEGTVLEPPASPEMTPGPVVPLPPSPNAPPVGTHWIGTWGASAATPSNESGAYYLTNVTVRQVARVSIGTKTGLRIRLSNALSRDAVSFGSVHVALWAGDAHHATSAIVAATDRVVTFAGSNSVTIPGGVEVYSDPIPLALPAGAELAVSFYIPRTSNVPATMHTFGDQTTYFCMGDSTGSAALANATTDTVRPYLTGIDVDAPGATAVVALGDSLTDGLRHWPDHLARRLQGEVGVVNEGIAGNCVVVSCFGPNIPDRFKRDVLTVSGVKSVIVLAGANDIGNAPDQTTSHLTEAYTNMVAMAHQQKIRVYGATIPPFGGSNYFTPAHEKLRQQVNTFIRSGGVFDGVIDFDKALADPANPAYLMAAFNGDKIRPNSAGYQAMAEAIDLTMLKP